MKEKYQVILRAGAFDFVHGCETASEAYESLITAMVKLAPNSHEYEYCEATDAVAIQMDLLRKGRISEINGSWWSIRKTRGAQEADTCYCS